MSSKSTAAERPRASAEPGRLTLVAILAWLIPGAGHLLLGRRQKGLVFLVAGALAARPPTESVERAGSAAAVLVAAGAALAVLVSLFAVWLGDRWSGQAADALAKPRHAISLAKRSRSVNPLAVEPLFTQALAEQELGFPERPRAVREGDPRPAGGRGDVVRARRVRPRARLRALGPRLVRALLRA
jgi:hypothetical protein